MNKTLLRRLYHYSFVIRRDINELEEINTFPGDDNNKTVDMHRQEIELKKEQLDMVEELLEMYISSFKPNP